MPHSVFFFYLYSPAFGLNTDIYSVNLRIQPDCGKMRTRKTPNTDSFCTVIDAIIVTLL